MECYLNALAKSYFLNKTFFQRIPTKRVNSSAPASGSPTKKPKPVAVDDDDVDDDDDGGHESEGVEEINDEDD